MNNVLLRHSPSGPILQNSLYSEIGPPQVLIMQHGVWLPSVTCGMTTIINYYYIQ